MLVLEVAANPIFTPPLKTLVVPNLLSNPIILLCRQKGDIGYWLLNLPSPLLTLFDMFARLAGLVVLLPLFHLLHRQKSPSFHVVLERDDLSAQNIEETRLDYFQLSDASKYSLGYRG
jgi:hypothetical protein